MVLTPLAGADRGGWRAAESRPQQETPDQARAVALVTRADSDRVGDRDKDDEDDDDEGDDDDEDDDTDATEELEQGR